MAILPLQLARVSNLLRTNVANQTVARTQAQMLQVQNELATGKRLGVPSDDPAAAAIVQQLRKTLEQRESYAANLQNGVSRLSEVDSTLGDVSDLLLQAKSIASANLGSVVTDEQRQSAAAILKSLMGQMLSLGNKQFQGMYLFGGDRTTAAPFVEQAGGIHFVGTTRTLSNAVDESTALSFSVDPSEVFGGLSSRVKGTADLTPQISAATRLVDVGGTVGEGIRRGSIRVSNGTQSAVIDLSHAETFGDVINAINAAGVGGVAATLDTRGLLLTCDPAENISVNEVAGGSMAADLGILRSGGAGAGAPLIGYDVQPRVTPLTPLSALRNGAGIDVWGGLLLTSGTNTTSVDLFNPPMPADPTVQDLINVINKSGANVRAEINDSGTGINLYNAAQGQNLSIAENGGTTAADLGIRSFSPDTPLSELNFGAGVRTVDGADLQITRADGTSFTVDLSNLQTVQDVIDAINAADGGGGVSAWFAMSGNGIVLTDNTGGGGTLRVTPLSASPAAGDLGLLEPTVANSINGKDVNLVRADGVFSSLTRLHEAMLKGDQAGITSAVASLQSDYDRVVRVRGQVGAQVQEMESRQDRLEQENVATQALLSSLEDTDFTEAVSRFQTLQNSLQASLMSSARIMELSLLDFLG